MKLAVCVLLAASGANALNAPKSGVAAVATHSAALQTAAPLAAKEVSAVPRGGLVANFVGVDVSLLSYFFFWYLGNYYCPRPRPLALKIKLRGAMDSVSDFESGGCGFESRRGCVVVCSMARRLHAINARVLRY